MAVYPAPQPGLRSQDRPQTHMMNISRWRVYTLFVVCILVTGSVALRLMQVQVFERDDWASKASAEINQHIMLDARRGTITDRFGNVMAMTIDRESLWVVPEFISDDKVEQLSVTLSTLLNQDFQRIYSILTDPEAKYVRLARWLDTSLAEQIEALDEPGLQLVYEPMRYYPQGPVSAHILGAVNHENVGLSGVENYYDEQLKGVQGEMIAEFDPSKNPITIAPQETRPARDGADLVLTIDPYIQWVAESELKAAVEQNSAEGGSVVIVEVQTGAIRGMASWPTFDPNNYNEYPPELYARNPAISNVYEPGSTFKMITVAAGLQARAFTADTLVNDTGVIYRHDYWLKNWNAAPNGMISPGDVLYHSSNVGALQLNELTGPQAFYETVRNFGFGASSGVDLGGEEAGIVNGILSTPTYNDLTLLTNAYGQGISVTPLQMTMAAAAIANDGVLMQPYIVEKFCEDDECITTEPVERGQAIDPGVAWTVRRMLVHSANHYAPVVWASQTANWGDQWLVPGYEVGAKTGTSSIPLEGGGYDQSSTIGSVLGFAPAEDARYAVLVKVDRPADLWGVSTAIPLYQKIVDQLMRHEGIPPNPQLYSPGQ